VKHLDSERLEALETPLGALVMPPFAGAPPPNRVARAACQTITPVWIYRLITPISRDQAHTSRSAQLGKVVVRPE
jgi:hypothetical protein